MFIPVSLRQIFGLYVRNLLKSSRGIIQVTPPWKDADSQLYNKFGWCIPNGFDPEEFNQTEKNQTNKKIFSIYFPGSIKFGQNMATFLKGLALLISEYEIPKKQIKFVYQGPQWEYVCGLAKSLNVLTNCQITPPVGRSQALKNMLAADILLLLSTDTSSCTEELLQHGFYPGKVFEFIGTQRRIILVPGDKGALESLLAPCPQARVAREPVQIKDNLIEGIEGKWLVDSNAASQFSQSFTREKMTSLLVDALNQSCLAKDKFQGREEKNP